MNLYRVYYELPGYGPSGKAVVFAPNEKRAKKLVKSIRPDAKYDMDVHLVKPEEAVVMEYHPYDF